MWSLYLAKIMFMVNDVEKINSRCSFCIYKTFKKSYKLWIQIISHTSKRVERSAINLNQLSQLPTQFKYSPTFQTIINQPLQESTSDKLASHFPDDRKHKRNQFTSRQTTITASKTPSVWKVFQICVWDFSSNPLFFPLVKSRFENPHPPTE